MKRYLVIGNPIEHSLSPRLHNYWFKENNIEAIYEKKQIKEADIKEVISEIEIPSSNMTSGLWQAASRPASTSVLYSGE